MPNFIDIGEKAKDLQTTLGDYEISDELEERIKTLQTDLDTQREGTATFLAYTAAIVFGIIVILPILFFFLYRVLDPGISDFIRSIVPSLTTLLGLVFGFYFSEKRLRQ